jgi:NADH:ubiquinone oxidoreductase subunit 6 (subunit J)
MERLYRFTFLCFLAWAAVSLIFLFSFMFCDEENCSTWRTWLNGITFVAACGLLILTVGAVLVTLIVRVRRR